MTDEPSGARRPRFEFLERVLDAVPDPIFVKDSEHRWVLFNDSFCRLVGAKREDLLGKSDFDFFPEPEARVFWDVDDRVLTEMREITNEENMTDQNGESHVLETKKIGLQLADGSKILIGVIRDITFLRTVEADLLHHKDHLEAIVSERTAELRQAYARLQTEVIERERIERERQQYELYSGRQQRMEALGLLAGGVAHDLNNLMTAISVSAEYLQSVAESEDSRSAAEQVLHGTSGAAALVRQLMNFARKGVAQRRPVNSNELVSGVAPLIERIIGNTIELEVIPGQGDLLVSGDPALLEQVLINLAINSRDAVPQVSGKISFEVDRVDGLIGAESSFVRIQVVDNGVGMTEEVRRRAFEPFFSTKADSGRMGLGLSMVQRTMDEHGGTIKIDSQLGGGTRIILTLPVYADDEEPVVEPEQRKGVSGRVLFVEDNDLVLRAGAGALNRLGYEVLTAGSALLALEVLRDRHSVVDCLVTDVMMPGMNGIDFAERARQIRPDLPIVLASALPQVSELSRESLRFGFLAKPYSHAELLEAVERARSGRSEASPREGSSEPRER